MFRHLREFQWTIVFFVFLNLSSPVWAADESDSNKCQPLKETTSAPSSDAGETTEECSIDPTSTQVSLRRNIIVDEANRFREFAESKGLEFHGYLKTEGSTDFHSGFTSDGADFRGLLETSVSLDLEKAFHWNGGRVSASLHDYFGSDATEDLIEDAQGFSNIDSSPMNRIYELWFEQTLAQGKVRFKAGRIDANTEFAYVENATEFLNSSMGFSPTILGLNTYPAPRTGGLVALKPANYLYVTLGDFRCPVHGDMAIGEVGTRWKLTNRLTPGRLAFGFWIHPHNREGFMQDSAFGVHGYYLIAEQMLWSAHPGAMEDTRGLRAFAQWGNADPMFSGISRHLGGGLEWVGPISRRPTDVLGVGATNVRLGQDYFQLPMSGSERSVESFYKISLRRWMSLTADLQLIEDTANSLSQTKPYVGTLRMTFSY